MIDYNDLRVFERVAALLSFSEAGRALGIPKSSVSRSIKRLEADLATQLLQRTTREAALTEAGQALYDRSTDFLDGLHRTVEYVGSLKDGPRGCLRVSAGIGFGINVLGDLLPDFLRRYPNIDIVLDLSSLSADLVGNRMDVAIRMGPMPDSQIVAKKLGSLHQYICASPDYLERRGTPKKISDLHDHDLIEIPVADGRKRNWVFIRDGEATEYRQPARVAVNDALTIHRLIRNGGGIGLVSGYLCVPDFESGRLVRLFSEWTFPAVQVHAVFPSQRELSPMVRAFIDYLCESSRPGHHWQNDPLSRTS